MMNHHPGNIQELDPCCQKEAENDRKVHRLMKILREHDRVALAERRRRNLIPNLSFGAGCRCCYDPEGDGGEYEALFLEREENQQETLKKEEDDEARRREEEEKEREKERYNGSDDDSSDDEFDYLLDELEPSVSAGNNGDGVSTNEVLLEIEENRRAELEFQMMAIESAKQHGYGVHRQMHPDRVLKTIGLGKQSTSWSHSTPPCVVLHLFTPSSRACGKMDLVLENIANRYLGTKFMRSSGRNTLLADSTLANKYLCFSSVNRPLQEKDIPCLVAIRDGHVQNISPLFSGLVEGGGYHIGETDTDEGISVDEYAVEEWLDRSGVLLRDHPPYDELCRVRPEEEALVFSMQLENKKEDFEQEKVEEQYYDCGRAGCCKNFAHKHIGEGTEKQDGLVVSENEIVQL